MASVNKCIFIGNLGRDPEMRYMPSGDAIANFSIACTENFKSKSGEKQERTEWVRVAIFGKLAEVAGEYLKKGSSVYIEGRMQTRKWQNKEGVDQYTTEIVADRMQMLGGRSSGGSYDGGMDQSAGGDDNYNQAPAKQGAAKSANAPAQTAAKPVASGSGFDDFEDDIPF
ncbi:MAG: single-stranded DNA-binding protein [Methylotenera sp.]|nr:single-stranded DNA-binding protein [Methylotenera sp.]NOT65882.1 single-stranded DNA-binding protein [Methylotenera sp.]